MSEYDPPNRPAMPANPSTLFKGLTVRQEYARTAMQGILSADLNIHLTAASVAIQAYEVADAMLKYESENPQ